MSIHEWKLFCLSYRSWPLDFVCSFMKLNVELLSEPDEADTGNGNKLRITDAVSILHSLLVNFVRIGIFLWKQFRFDCKSIYITVFISPLCQWNVKIIIYIRKFKCCKRVAYILFQHRIFWFKSGWGPVQ